jgi:alpha-mannosidase
MNRIMNSTVALAAVAGLALGISGTATAQTAAQGSKAPAKIAPPANVDLSKPTLFVVGYAHLDTQWRWAYPQTIREFIANTLEKNFALFEKYPNYVFNFSGSRRYAMMKEYYPEYYTKLKDYIAQGRWFPCGSSVDENDANVPSAESLVRQVLYGNKYFRSEFGVASDEYMLPDCFGFPAALPQVLGHCGVKGFSTQKLTWNACVPIPFKVGVWNGPDGTGVIAALDPGAYVGEVKENLANANSWQKRIEANGKVSGVFADYHYFGTGDMGGAPQEASVGMVEKSIETSGAIKVIESHADWLFNAITPEMRSKLPVYQGELELTEHSAGSLTSQSYMKRWNRKNELLADAAERAAVAAAWIGARDYPSQKLEDAWYLVLGSQMHDILPGTSLPKAYEYSWNDEVLAANQFAAVLEDSAAAVIASMNTQVAGTPVVVYNPTSIEREDVVEAWVAGAGASVKVTDASGKDVAAQVIGSDSSRTHVAFLAKAPSVGFITYSVTLSPAAAQPQAVLKVQEKSLENDRYVVTLNDDGDIASVLDKKAHRELLSGPSRLGLYYENPAQWPAWNQDWADRQRPAKSFVSGPANFKVVENGPARIAVEVTRHAEGSTFVQRISLASGGAGDRIESSLDIDWVSRERSLRVTFPLSASNPNATFDVQSGVIQRPNSHPKQFEYAFHQWFDLTDTKGDYGVSVMCDSKYGSDKPDDHTVRLTLLHTPGTRGGYQDQGSQDIGRHHIQYAFTGHEGSWQKAQSPLAAARFNQPLIPFAANAHAGPLGSSFSLVHTNDPNVLITAVKKAELDNSVVVRLRELPGTGASGVKVAMAAPISAAKEVDGQERGLGDAKIDGGQVVTDVRGFGLRAFSVSPAASSVKAAKVASTPVKLAFDTDVASTNAKRTDGSFDSKGNSIPAEQLPRTLNVEGVRFELGSTADGQMNAVSCAGQEIKLPQGSNVVYVLAAATEDVDVTLGVGAKSVPWHVQSWGGYVGQWDNRLWKGEAPVSAYSWSTDIAGLVPGYVKSDSVAWYCSHHHNAKGDAHYEYSYLFKYAVELPSGTTSIKLPNDGRVKVLAVSGGQLGSEKAIAAAPLFDTLADHVQDGVRIVAPAGAQSDSAEVTVTPGLYWRNGGVHYTLDGSAPSEKSPVYTGPIKVSSSATVKAAVVSPSGKVGEIASASLQVSDTTPPSIKRVMGVATSSTIAVEFSEPVDKLAPANFSVSPAKNVKSVELLGNGCLAVLTLDSALESNGKYTVTAKGIKDVSSGHNSLASADAAFSAGGAVFTLAEVKPEQLGTTIKDIPGLPVKAHDTWTLNMFVKVEKQPANHTVIVGFGRCEDDDGGVGRYVCKFANGAHFWSAKQDVEGRTALDLNRWQMLTATYDGSILRMYKDGKKIGEAPITLVDDRNEVNIAPKDPWDHKYTFNGELRGISIWNTALGEDSLAILRDTGGK